MVLPINIRLNTICLWNRISKNTKKTPNDRVDRAARIKARLKGSRHLTNAQPPLRSNDLFDGAPHLYVNVYSTLET